jgi:hypothetical protein
MLFRNAHSAWPKLPPGASFFPCRLRLEVLLLVQSSTHSLIHRETQLLSHYLASYTLLLDLAFHSPHSTKP